MGVGGEKASEAFSAHSVSTLTWTQGRLCLPSESHLELRHLAPCHAHSHVHSMNSLKTPFAPCAAEALMSAHLFNQPLQTAKLRSTPSSHLSHQSCWLSPTSSRGVPGHVPERQQAKHIHNNPSLQGPENLKTSLSVQAS